MTPAMAYAICAGFPRGLFVSIEHPDGTAYFTTGVGKRDWDGHTWTGTGNLGSISPVKHTSEIAVQDITFSISGVDTDVAAGLSDNVRNLSGQAWLVCFNPADDSVVAEPYKLVDSELDYQVLEIQEDGTTTIRITAHAGFYTLDRGIEEAWTPENQKLTYPDDTGLDMIPSLQKQDLQWTPT